MLNKKYKVLSAALLCAVCLSGCKKTSEEEVALGDFSSSIEDFTDYLKDADERINSLDVNEKESVDELLSVLDGMNSEVGKLQTLNVPAQYAGIKNPVDKAAEHMSLAVSYYHSAYESDAYSAEDADMAYYHYQKAMKCIEYMGYVIAGDEIPEDENVTVYEEVNDANLFDKWLSGEKEDENETTSESVSEADVN